MEARRLERPPHVDPDWWSSRTWYAKRRIVDEHHRSNRPADKSRPIEDPVDVMPAAGRKQVPSLERAAAVELCFEAGYTAQDIVDAMGVRAATIIRALERAGRRDLMPDFYRLRRIDEGRAA